MSRRWLSTVACLLALAAISISLGCSHYWARERTRRRADVVKMDWYRTGDDLDWVLGFDESSILYEDSFPPKP